MKATEVNISNLITEVKEIKSRLERLSVRIESYLSPDGIFTINDNFLKWASDKVRDASSDTEYAADYLKMISKEENNGN